MASFAKAAESRGSKARPAQQPAEPEVRASPTSAATDGGEKADDASAVPEQPKATLESPAARKARAEREAELRRMMEEDESEVESAPASPEEVVDEASPESKDVSETTAAAENPLQGADDSQPGEGVSDAGNGRRRKRRRVIKKKQVQDDEGYFGESCNLNIPISFSSASNQACVEI
jgi:DNA polymerase delta subunit 3